MPKPEYLEAGGFVVEVLRTGRTQTADVRVEEGAVSIVVPRDLAVERIEQILADKRQWLLHKIALHREAHPVQAKDFVSGEAIPYLGRNYRLKVLQGPFSPAKLVQGRLVVITPKGAEQPHMIRNAIIRWYKINAEKKLKQKAKRYARMMGLELSGLGVKDFKSRWGSCSKHGRIDLNWRIIMAPNKIADYVVLHELCHLIHHDHSAKFWREVERVMPEYQEAKQWLRDNGHRLEV